jgi:PAS domain S-box-containing protein
VENAQDGIYQSTPQGKFLYANPALLQMLGYSNLSEITGNFDVRDIYADPAQREEFKSELNRNGSVRNFNCRLKTKDGRILSVMENALIIMKPDNTLVYEGFLRDFTDYEVLKEDLKSSQNFASELMDKANMLVAIADSDNDVFFWNLKAEQVTGYKRSDLIGHPDLFAEMIGLSDKPAINQSGVFTGDERLHICSFRARSNEEKIIGWTRSLFHTRDLGSLQVFFGIDLTETKKLEERLIEARKMEIFAVFASRVARGFDEVFAKGISSLLSLQKKPEINSELQQYLSELDSSLRSGLQLTQQILSLTKRSEFSYRLINPTDLVEQAVMLLKQTCPANIAIDAAFTVAGAIEAEPAQLYQAILNVALNAIEAMPDGGKLTVRTSRIGPDSLRRPKNGELDEKDFIRIEIEDTGIGIRDEDLKHIFDPFFSTKENGKTRGIGLTLTQKIIQEHHGFLQVESRINQGTTVSIYLPVAKKAAERVAAKQQKPITGSQKQTVMVVDDESIILDLIEDILASDGYKIFTAENGLDAMRIYEVQPMQFDLVILDVIMPKMDGRELFYKMRELNPSVKIIITSGFSKPDIREELLEQGADGFLQKPFTIDVLTNLVHSALE